MILRSKRDKYLWIKCLRKMDSDKLCKDSQSICLFSNNYLLCLDWDPPVRWWAQSLGRVLTLCVSIDCGLPGSSVHGILQARILEWVTIFSSRRSSWHRDQKCVLHQQAHFYHLATWEDSHIGLLRTFQGDSKSQGRGLTGAGMTFSLKNPELQYYPFTQKQRAL